MDVSSLTPRRDFMLGPGDILRISVPLIDQLRNRSVRVSEQGTIALPLLGEITVAGKSELDLRNELSRRVAKYMYHPQVEVFLLHTENRQVGVLGSVKTPGRYMLASHSDTLMTLISRAGGMNESAASRIILLPASEDGEPQPELPLTVTHAQGVPSDNSLPAKLEFGVSKASLRQPPDSDTAAAQIQEEGLVINLSRAENQRFLALPARPGDVIIVPAAGEVTVQGWVEKPGVFKITPGMTVLSGVTAAGGALFSSSVTLLREQPNGGKLNLPLDLGKIKSSEQPDIALQGGDVVVVERSLAGAVPYSLYFLVSKVGVGLPLY